VGEGFSLAHSIRLVFSQDVPITGPVETLVLITVLALTVAVAAGLAKGVLSLVLRLMAEEARPVAAAR
jgi:hypothetical protein